MKKITFTLLALLLTSIVLYFGFKPFAKTVLAKLEQERTWENHRLEMQRDPSPIELDGGRVYCASSNQCTLVRS